MINCLNCLSRRYLDINTIIYNLALYTYKKETLFARFVEKLYNRRLQGKAKDAPVLSRLNHQSFTCPFSHKLLFYQKEFPLYDRQLSKLCLYMKKKLNRSLNIIDVGANVGDSVVNIGMKDGFYLCIEGDESFSRYLESNLRKYRYSLERCLLSDVDEYLPYTMNTSNGTGHLVKEDTILGNAKLIKLDSLLNEKYADKVFDLLKIDTDGFDFKVIRGTLLCLQKQHPLLFFEWDKEFLGEQGEDNLSVFPMLYESGYTKCILFDNFGNPIGIVGINDYGKLRNYIENTRGNGLPFYYDVLAIPEMSPFDTKQLYCLFSGK